MTIFQTVTGPGAAGNVTLGGINNAGVVDGSYIVATLGDPTNPNPHSFTMANGVITNLGNDRGASYATGAINNGGTVVGTTGDAISGIDGICVVSQHWTGADLQPGPWRVHQGVRRQRCGRGGRRRLH